MILQALTDYYQALEQVGKIAAPGWKRSDISFVLCISDTGNLEQIVSIRNQVPQGKRMVLRPQPMVLPAPADGRTSTAVRPNFLWDKSDYLLGISKGGIQRGLKYFNGSKEYHETILSGIISPAASALLEFFQRWNPEKASEHPLLQDVMEDILKGANMVFRYSGGYIHEDTAIKNAWQKYYTSQTEGVKMTCLVTGEQATVARIHPKIKGIINGEAMGNTLVGFNFPSVCSYGKEQSYNAPVGQQAVFAYTAALNHLLSDRDHIYQVGDATVVCWARSGEQGYQDVFQMFFSDFYGETDLKELVGALCQGNPVVYDETKLDPNMDFYILGLSPNAARLSVRFFLHNTFGGFLRNVQAHYDRLEIVRPTYDKFETLPLWKLLGETVNQNARDKSPAPDLAGEVLRAVLTNTRYPATLLNSVTLRIRAEREVTRGRAAIIKAYYLKLAEITKQENPDIPEEVLQVSLNPDASNVPYTLGRLFSVLEAIQAAVNPGINATIKDKYFSSAAATPAVIFPVLINLAQKHLKKLRGSNAGLVVFYEKQLTELCSHIGKQYPVHMNLPQQGSFQLGYYCQTQARYQKKEETRDV